MAETNVNAKREDPELSDLYEYVELQARIDAGEESAILARWEMGKLLWQEREANGGKQLPHGRRAEVINATGVSRTEVAYRIQFYDQYPTQEEVSTAVDTYRSWTEIRHTLTAPKEHAAEDPPAPAGDDRAEMTVTADWLTYREDMREGCPDLPAALSPDTEDEELRRAHAIMLWYDRDRKHIAKLIAGVHATRTDRDQTRMEVSA